MPLEELELTDYPKIRIYAYRHSDKRCDFIKFMEELDDKTREAFFNRLTMLSESGLASLPKKVFHIAGDRVLDYTMYRLEAGQYRLYMGVGSKDVIIVITHGTMKKTQKTSKKDKDFFENCIKRLKRE